MKQLRRKAALGRLQSQLRSGVKTVKGSLKDTTELTETDVKRINREIDKLKTRLV